MKRIKLFVMAMVTLAASTALCKSLPANEDNIRKAEASPSAAKNFIPCPSNVPNGLDADVPGDVVFVNSSGRLVQYGSSLSEREAYLVYCGPGGGGGE